MIKAFDKTMMEFRTDSLAPMVKRINLRKFLPLAPYCAALFLSPNIALAVPPPPDLRVYDALEATGNCHPKAKL
jgi:hypothetical protein